MFSQKISSKNVPAAVGPYSAGIKLGDFVYLSGQLPIDATTNEVVEGGIKEQTTQVLKNMNALLEEMGLEPRHVVKTTVFMTDLGEFSEMNEVYGSFFVEPYPARSTIQVVALPKGVKVEIECLVIDTLAYEKQASQGCQSCSSQGCDDGCDDGCEGSCCGR